MDNSGDSILNRNSVKVEIPLKSDLYNLKLEPSDALMISMNCDCHGMASVEFITSVRSKIENVGEMKKKGKLKNWI